MVSIIDSVILVVRWFHILGAVGWGGTILINYFVLGPFLASLEPKDRISFLVKFLPRFVNFFVVFSLITISAGAITALFKAGFDLGIAIRIPWGNSILAGAVLSLIMVALALGVALPASRGFLNTVREGNFSPQDIAKPISRIRFVGKANLVLVFIVLFLMVFAVDFAFLL